MNCDDECDLIEDACISKCLNNKQNSKSSSSLSSSLSSFSFPFSSSSYSSSSSFSSSSSSLKPAPPTLTSQAFSSSLNRLFLLLEQSIRAAASIAVLFFDPTPSHIHSIATTPSSSSPSSFPPPSIPLFSPAVSEILTEFLHSTSGIITRLEDILSLTIGAPSSTTQSPSTAYTEVLLHFFQRRLSTSASAYHLSLLLLLLSHDKPLYPLSLLTTAYFLRFVARIAKSVQHTLSQEELSTARSGNFFSVLLLLQHSSLPKSFTPASSTSLIPDSSSRMNYSISLYLGILSDIL